MIRLAPGPRGPIAVQAAPERVWVPIWPLEPDCRLFALGWILGQAVRTRTS